MSAIIADVIDCAGHVSEKIRIAVTDTSYEQADLGA
ncbi:hypothetical protein O982_24695 [Mycobacterium avium 10-5581]|nr:hypothetical protein O982_24695 [Mycobacterium avium 10-5581]